MRGVIPDLWALIVKSALPGTCSTVGSMQLEILACKIRMDIHIHEKVKYYTRPYIVQIYIHKQQNMICIHLIDCKKIL